MEESDYSNLKTYLLLALSLITGIIFDILFYGHFLGINYPLFVLTLLGVFFLSTKENVKFNGISLFLLVVILFLASNFAIHSNTFILTMDFLAIPLLLIAYTIVSTESYSSSWASFAFIGDFFIRIFPLTLENIPVPFKTIKRLLRKKDKKEGNKVAKSIGLGLLISIPVLYVVLALLSSADLVFKHYFFNMFELLKYIKLGSWPVHLIVVFIISLIVFSYVYGFRTENKLKLKSENSGFRVLDPVVVITLLTVINIIYLLFTSIQFSYLYSGAQKILPEGFTFAQYARRGFFELVFVAVINISILLFSLGIVKRESKKLFWTVKALLGLMILFTMNMLFASHYKMSLYEQTYGFTYLRLYVDLFIGMLLVMFIASLIHLLKKEFPLIKSYIIIALASFVILNYANVDKIIAQENISRYYNTGKIDVYYLTSLSDDAVPELIQLTKEKDKAISDPIIEHLYSSKKLLEKNKSWQTYNYSSNAALKMINDFISKNPDAEKDVKQRLENNQGAMPSDTNIKATPYKIVSMKAYLHYTDDGSFSENIIDNPNFALYNVVIGEGSAKGPSDATRVDVEIEGSATSQDFSRKVELNVVNEQGKRVYHKISDIFIADNGKCIVTFLVDGTGSEKLNLTASILFQQQQSTITKELNFFIGE